MLASIDSIEYITNEELEFVEVKISAMEVSVCRSVSIGAAWVLRASNERASRIPHTMPGEPVMMFSKQLIRAFIILKLSSINVLGSFDLSAIFILFGLTFFENFF